MRTITIQRHSVYEWLFTFKEKGHVIRTKTMKASKNSRSHIRQMLNYNGKMSHQSLPWKRLTETGDEYVIQCDEHNCLWGRWPGYKPMEENHLIKGAMNE